MAIPFLNHLDLQSVSQLQNAILHKTTSATASDVEGKIIYDTGSDTIKYYNGSAWIELGGDTVRTVGVDTNGDGTVNNTLENSEDLVFKKGTNITLTEAGGVITISSTDTNTTYTAGTGLTLSGTTFNANVEGTIQTTGANSVTSTASRTYAVQVDSSDNLVVNVPWVDTDTNTDTLQSITADSANADRYITTVANDSGAQTGYSHANLKYNPFNETLTVTNLIVSGTSTTINTETINLADNIITLNSNEEGTPSQDAGIEVERGTEDNVSLNWNESTDDWEFDAYDHAATPALTTYKIPRTYSTYIGDGSAQSFTVTHNLGTKLIIVQLFEVSSDATVYADVVRTDDNTITITTATTPALLDIAVLISTAGA